MYLANKYTTWYMNIVTKVQTRTISKSIYTEIHHIIPKSLGGSNHDDNLVKLTAKEHFICHLLLTKMTSSHKMVYAAWAMSNQVNEFQQRHKINASTYAILREKFAAVKRQSTQSPAARKKNSDSHKGIRWSLGMTNKKHSVATIEKMKAERAKQVITEDTKDKLSKILIGIANDPAYINPMDRDGVREKHQTACLLRSSKKKECPHCGGLFSANAFARYHGDKCKLRDSQVASSGKEQ